MRWRKGKKCWQPVKLRWCGADDGGSVAIYLVCEYSVVDISGLGVLVLDGGMMGFLLKMKWCWGIWW